MNTSLLLDRLADKTAYNAGVVAVRWGQLLRSNASISVSLAELATRERVANLGSLGQLHSGVVPRANAYFIVRELPFDKIPARMHVTRSDTRRIAVVVDGLDFACKIERAYLKPILKGPDSLESAFTVRRTDLRLFDVKDSKEELVSHSATGALAYLTRGESVPYNNSSDPLKGGVPARRSQVKNRRPYWYSLGADFGAGAPRIVLPEHHDKRYVFTLVGADDDSVVIDTLYTYRANESDDLAFTHAGLNSLLSWYQVELRGRSQHGDGVLKVKLPDYRGILLANPRTVEPSHRAEVLETFAALIGAGKGPSFEELGTPERLAFDTAYLRACGFDKPDQAALMLEHELRALAGERVERKLSIADAKVSRRKATAVAATVDAYAAKIVAMVQPYPDPRSFLVQGEPVTTISILSQPNGAMTIGSGLFDAGELTDGEALVARAGSVVGASLVKTVLMLDPGAKSVDLPADQFLHEVHVRWQSAAERWKTDFDGAVDRCLVGVTDARTRRTIISLALGLLHVGAEGEAKSRP